MQTRFQSLLESVLNVLIGFGVAFAAQLLIFPLLGIPVSLNQNLLIGAFFTAVSIARSYCVRRIFNWLHRPEITPATASANGINGQSSAMPKSTR